MKKRFSYIFALSLALSALTACGGEEDKPNNPVMEQDAGMDVQPDSGDIVAPDAGPDVTPDAGEEVTTDGGEEEVDAGPQGPTPVDELTDKELWDEAMAYYSLVFGIVQSNGCRVYLMKSEYTEEYADYYDSLRLNAFDDLQQESDFLWASIDAGRMSMDKEALRFLVKQMRPLLSDIVAKEDINEICSLYYGSIAEISAAYQVADDKYRFNGGFTNPLVGGGERCTLSMECLTGQCQRPIQSSCDGICAPLGKLDEACRGDAGCVTGLKCSNLKCIVPRPENESCGRTDDCADGLYCIFGKCSAKHTEGQGCNDSRDCAEGLRCNDTWTCNPPLPDNANCKDWKSGCADGSTCQKISVLPEMYQCMKKVELGATCSISADTHNDLCANYNTCADGVCVPYGTRTEGQTCFVQHQDTSVTDYGCAPGYKCNSSNQCEKLSEIGETCAEDKDCVDVSIDINISGTYFGSDHPFPPSRNSSDNAKHYVPTSVRCVASTVENKKVCQKLQDVGGACMASFPSPESGCKGDLLCMPNEDGADANGYTGTCQKAPGINEACMSHDSYPDLLLCDPATAVFGIHPENGCVCRPKRESMGACSETTECPQGHRCRLNLCVPVDMILNSRTECSLFENV